MSETTEKLTEVLNQICEKFGITMDENIYSLSELAKNLTNEIVLFNLVFNAIILIVFIVISVILFGQYKKRHEDDNIIDRCKNLLDYYIPEYKSGSRKNSVLYKKIEKSNMFKLSDYIIDTIIMCCIIFILFNIGISSISYISEIVKSLVAPDMVVVDYFMEYYLNG